MTAFINFVITRNETNYTKLHRVVQKLITWRNNIVAVGCWGKRTRKVNIFDVLSLFKNNKRLPIKRYRKSLSRTKKVNASLWRNTKSLKITRTGQLRSRAGHRFWWKESLFCGRKRSLYLYNGTGNPWAGHSNVIAPLRYTLNVCESASDGNFGRELATGSMKIRRCQRSIDKRDISLLLKLSIICMKHNC